jgi:hypothetical protein
MISSAGPCLAPTLVAERLVRARDLAKHPLVFLTRILSHLIRVPFDAALEVRLLYLALRRGGVDVLQEGR